MDSTRWQLVDRVLQEVLDQPPAGRKAYLLRACGDDTELRREVESLLEFEEVAETDLSKVVGEAARQAAQKAHDEDERSLSGAQLGPYTLVREIGHGGMGNVFLAVRSDENYLQTVAIKLMRSGLDSAFLRRRFLHERQILATLDHPNIARILDGGATPDGRPYVVMEYIEGKPIGEYCEQHGLSIPERLDLFRSVCAAVHHAHQKLVIHRDIKPGNILVTDGGTPKLLDFGIAKLLIPEIVPGDAPMTETAVRMMTPDYASPEQVRGEPITTAADVYSLGVLLYELIAGRRPYQVTGLPALEVERAICHENPQRPSDQPHLTPKQRRELRGDLDNIVLMALRKEPHRRYGSAQQLGEDVHRYLRGLPVIARRDTFGYRLTKIVQRNKAASFATAALVLTLLAGIYFTWREAMISRRYFEQVRTLANTFVFDVHDAVKDLPGSTRARELIVVTGLQYLDGLASEARRDWALQRELAAAYLRIADVQGNVMSSNLGDPKGALETSQKALALLDRLAAHDPSNLDVQLNRMEVHRKIGDIHSYIKGPKDSLKSLADGASLGDALLKRWPKQPRVKREMAEVLHAESRVLRGLDRNEEALKQGLRALELFESLGGKEAKDDPALLSSVASAYAGVGMAQSRLGQLKPALENFKKSVSKMELLTFVDPGSAGHRRQLMLAYSHVGDVLGNPTLPNLGDEEGAQHAYRQMLAIAKDLYQRDPADQRAMADYGIALMRVANSLTGEKRDEQVKLFREADATLEQVALMTPQNYMNLLNLAFVRERLGVALEAGGDRAGARRSYSEGVSAAERAAPSQHVSAQRTLVSSLCRLALLDAANGNRADALAWSERALAEGRKLAALPKASTQQQAMLAKAAHARGTVHARLGEKAEAVRWYEQAQGLWKALGSQLDSKGPLGRERQETDSALAAMR